MATAYPSDIEDLCKLLNSDVTWLFHRWQAYKALYAKSEQRIDFLNETATSFFFVVQETLYDDVTLSISRLCDPATSGGGRQTNATLERLVGLIAAEEDQPFHLTVSRLLAALRALVAPLKEYRHKRLAHADLEVAMGRAIIAGPSRDTIDRALTLIAELLNAVAHHYRDTTILFEHFVTPGGPDDLVGLLKAGLRYQALLLRDVIPYDDDYRGEWGDA